MRQRQQGPQEIRIRAGLTFGYRPYGPGSDLRFIAGYHTASEGPGINPEDNLSAVGAALTNLGRIAPIEKSVAQGSTAEESDYEKIDLLSQQFDSTRVLIVRLGAMGDILHALPAVAALRRAHPKWYLGWAVEPRWRPLLSGDGGEMPLVDRTHLVKAKEWARAPLRGETLREIAALRHALRAEHYDLCIDLQGAVRSALAGRLAGAPRMIGEDQPREWAARWLFGERVATQGVHVIEQAVEVCAAAAGEPLSPFFPPCRATARRKSGRMKYCVGQTGQWSC